MAKNFFVELPDFCIKARIKKDPQDKSPFVFVWIFRVLDNGCLSKDTIVQFKKEGSCEILERRIAIFDNVDNILTCIEDQITIRSTIATPPVTASQKIDFSNSENFIGPHTILADRKICDRRPQTPRRFSAKI